MSLVLFLHGEHFIAMGRPFLDRLGAGRELHAPLYPGYDGAPPDPDFRSVDDLAYRYLDLLEEMDARDATIVGCSLGGWVALEMAVRDRSRIGRIALLAPVGVKLSGREERDFADLPFMREAEAARTLFHDPARWAPDHAALDEAAVETIALERQWTAWYGWKPYMHNPVLAKWLHRAAVPTLLLWGESDGFAAPDYGRRLAARLPDARFETIPDAGHYPHIERADATADAVLAFLENA